MDHELAMLKLVNSSPPGVEKLLGRWTADAETFSRYGQIEAAAIVAKMAGELREALDIAPGASMAQAAPQEAATGLLGVDEAAKRLGMSKSWLYRHGARLPFARKIGARLLFDPDGLAAWSRTKSRDKAA